MEGRRLEAVRIPLCDNRCDWRVTLRDAPKRVAPPAAAERADAVRKGPNGRGGVSGCLASRLP